MVWVCLVWNGFKGGDPEMTSTRGPWVRFLVAGACIALAPIGRQSAHAQGFSPDPFKPFNSEYQQYAYPISPFAGGPGAAAGMMGRADNQYQRYLKELEGADRALNQRYGIGVPHWKLRSDAKLDKLAQQKRGMRRPKEDAATSISKRYIAYFTEDDPKKRAELMRDFTANTGLSAPEGLARSDKETDTGGAGGLSGAGGRSGSSASSRESAKAGDAAGRRSAAPPPPRGRFGSGAGRVQRRPSDVLDRSRRLDDDLPGPRLPAAGVRRRSSGDSAPVSPDD
jgi:hypothetical protein